MVPGSSPLVALSQAGGEFVAVLADPLGDEAGSAAGERSLDDLAGCDVDFGFVASVAGVDVQRRCGL